MKKTKIFAIICSVVLALSAFASCAQEDNSTEPIATTTTQVTVSTTAREVPPADDSSEKSTDSDSSNEDSSNSENSETDSDESSITTSDAGSETESSQDGSSDEVTSTTTTSTATTTTTTTSAKITSTTKGVEFTATSKTVYTTVYTALRTSPSDSGTIIRYINPNETVLVTSVSTDGKWYKVSYAGNSGYTTTQGTTTTKPAVTSKTTTTTTTKKTTTTTTTAKVDPMAWVHAGGTCKYCNKKFSGNAGYTLSPAYSAPESYKLSICNSCLNNKCFNCGKTVNSSSATKCGYNYIDQNWKSVTLCNYWLCYDCYPEGDPQYYTKLARKSEQEMLTLTQQLRAANGRTQFYVDPQMTEWAQTRAKELATKFAHFRLDGDAGIGIIDAKLYRHAGENIAMAWGTTNGTALYKALEESTGHKGTMLNSQYTAIGIGVYYDPNTGYSYACQLFGGND